MYFGNVRFWPKEDGPLQLSARLRQFAEPPTFDSLESRCDVSGDSLDGYQDRPCTAAGALLPWCGLRETGLAANRFWQFLERCAVALLRPNRVAICRTTGFEPVHPALGAGKVDV